MDRRTKMLLALAAGCGLLFLLVLVAAYDWGPSRSLDLRGFEGFVTANEGELWRLTHRLTNLADAPTVAFLSLVLAAVAALRGRPRVAIAVLALVAVTSVSSQILKQLLAHSREAPFLGYPIGPEAFPSGHATAAMTLALAGILVVPRAARPAAAILGALFALTVGVSVMATAWHFPSDVIGGYLLATGWALVAVAGLREAERRFPARAASAQQCPARLDAADRGAERGLAAIAVIGVLTAVAGTLAYVAADLDAALGFACDYTSAVAIGAGVASAALVLPVAMAAVAPPERGGG
jgi:membrane-associated phospholipid phosphatase